MTNADKIKTAADVAKEAARAGHSAPDAILKEVYAAIDDLEKQAHK